MKKQKFDRYWVVRLEKGEEIITALTQAVKEAGIEGGFFYGLGVGTNLELGYFEAHNRPTSRRYSLMSMNSPVFKVTSHVPAVK